MWIILHFNFEAAVELPWTARSLIVASPSRVVYANGWTFLRRSNENMAVSMNLLEI
jgi:hypothetical protein